MTEMTGNLRLLHVEDSESDGALVLRLLRKAGWIVQSQRVEEAGAMRLALASQEWDLVIADYQLPQFSAAEALRIRNELAGEVPFIVVSGTIGEDCAVEMIRSGAGDYILKDRLARLVPAVQREIQEAQSKNEHRQVAARLRDRDQWLALAVDATQLGTFDFYPQSRRLVLSESARGHLGLKPDGQVSYEEVVKAIHLDDRERIEILFRKACEAAGGEFMTEGRAIGIEDRTERWLAAQGKVFFDGFGRPVRFVGVTQDITQRKQIEKRLTMLDRAKSDFLNLISHEFRTPLNGLLGVGGLLLDELPRSGDDKLRGVFDRCRRRILSILDDALLLAEIDVDGGKFKFSSVPMAAALVQATERAAVFADSRRVTIASPPAVAKHVWANEELLTRALHSLLEAAVKFSEAGGTVQLSCHALPHSLEIFVESRGRSIPQASLARFFEIFAIGDSIVPGGDLGLGPAVACRILSLFGGSVSVANLDPPGIQLTISLENSAPQRGIQTRELPDLVSQGTVASANG